MSSSMISLQCFGLLGLSRNMRFTMYSKEAQSTAVLAFKNASQSLFSPAVSLLNTRPNQAWDSRELNLSNLLTILLCHGATWKASE